MFHIFLINVHVTIFRGGRLDAPGRCSLSAGFARPLNEHVGLLKLLVGFAEQVNKVTVIEASVYFVKPS